MSQVSYGTITITDIASSGSTNQHFWFNPTQQGTLLAGAYITDTPINTFKTAKSGGYLLTRSDGVILGKAANRYMELSGSSLKFYKAGTTDSTASNVDNIAATLSTNGLEITNGSITLGTYDSNLSSYPFQVTSAGVLTARSGSIGKFNLSDTALTAGTTTTAIGLGGDQAFWAGSNVANSAPFRVGYNGELYSGDTNSYIHVYQDAQDNNAWKTNIKANEIYLTAFGDTSLGDVTANNIAQIALKVDKENLASEINAVADQITLSADRIIFQSNTVADQLANQQTDLTTLQNAVQINPENSSIILGDETSFHIKIIGDSTDTDYGLGFYYGTTKVSYMSDQKLNIPYSVVLKEMQLSDKWSWTQKESGNMTLVWIGETN